MQYLLANAIYFQKLPWYETMEFSLLHSAILLLLFLSVPIVAIIWRASPRLREQAARQPRGAHLARLELGWMVVLYFISTGGMFSAFATQDAVLYGNAVAFIVGNYLAIPIALLAVVAVFCAVLAWRQGYWSLAWRIHYTLVTLAGVSVLW